MKKVLSIVVIGFIVLSSLFVVQEGQNALVLRLGKIIKVDQGMVPKNFQPGIHVKIPLVDHVLYYDKRLQTLSPGNHQKVLTAEQKRLIVDYYVKWRIVDLAQFYKSTSGDVSKAEYLLMQRVNDTLRAAFGERTINEVVSGERSAVMKLLKSKADDGANALGIAVVDVRIKKIDLPQEVQESVYSRMSTDRERVATKHRSQGKSESEKIKAQADANVTLTIAKARQEAAAIRAKGQEEAAEIYNRAYGANPSFYRLYTSLHSYAMSFNAHDIVLLDPNSEFLRKFNAYGPFVKKR